MNHCCVDDSCIVSISSHCDQRCGQKNHIPPSIPIFDGHIHLNQIIPKLQSDLVSVRVARPIREFHFINMQTDEQMHLRFFRDIFFRNILLSVEGTTASVIRVVVRAVDLNTNK